MLMRYSTFRRSFATSSTIRVNLKGVEGKKNVDSGKRFSLYMDDVFKSTNPQEINQYITTFLPRMKTSSVVSLLTTAFDNRYQLSEHQIEQIAAALAQGQHSLKTKQAADIIHSLGRHKGPTPAILSLMRVVARDYPKSSLPAVPLSPRNICGMLTGMQGMYAIHPEEKDVLRLIKTEIMNSPSTFTPRDFFFALQGLQNLTSSIPEVREMLAALTSRKYDPSIPFNVDEMATSLYALRNMRTTEVEVIDTVAFLVQNMRASPLHFEELSLVKSLIGVSNLMCTTSRREAPVAEMLDLLAEQVEQFDDIFELKSVVNVVASLKFKDDNVVSVGRLHRAVADKIYSHKDMKSQRKYAGRGRLCKNKDLFAKLFMTFNHLSRPSPDVRYLREALVNRLHFELTTKEGRVGFVDLDDATLCTLTYGLSEMKNTSLATKRGVIDSTEVKEVDQLWMLVSQMVRASSLLHLHAPESVCRISRNLKNLSLPPADCGNDSTESPEIKHLLTSLGRLFDTTVKSRHVDSKGSSRWTREEVFQTIYGLRNMHSSHNEVRQLLRSYVAMLREAVAVDNEPMTADLLTSMLQAMTEKDIAHDEVSDLFQIIVGMVSDANLSTAGHPIQLSPVQYIACLSGLSGCGSSDNRVRAILQYLNGHVNFILSVIENHNLSDSRMVTFTAVLAGLRHMNIEDAEVRTALSNVAAFMSNERERGGPMLTKRCKGYTGALEHLKHWDASVHSEAEDVLGQFVGVMRGNRVVRNKYVGVRGVTLALIGMQSTDIDASRAAIDMLTELSINMKSHTTSHYDFRAVCDIVNGFRSTSSAIGNEVIHEFLSVLGEKYPSNQQQVAPSDLLKFLSGMRRIDTTDHPGTEGLWDSFVQTVSRAQIADDSDNKSMIEVAKLLQSEDYTCKEGAAKLLETVTRKRYQTLS
jgi:hypothetical protein